MHEYYADDTHNALFVSFETDLTLTIEAIGDSDILNVPISRRIVRIGTVALTFEPPRADNKAWINTILLLGTEHPYLAIDDDGDGVWDANPTARVTFGIYTGPFGRILLRDVPAN